MEKAKYKVEDLIVEAVEETRQELIKAVIEVFKSAEKREDRVELEDILKLLN